MHITPAMMEAAYTFLRETRPFKAWKLPDADDVEFQVKSFGHVGDYQWRFAGNPEISENWQHRIRVNPARHPHWTELLRTMAHEMIHLHQRRSAAVAHKRQTATHGKFFQNTAKEVCRLHGWDIEGF